MDTEKLEELFAGNNKKAGKYWTACGHIQKLLFMEIVFSEILLFKICAERPISSINEEYSLEKLRIVFLMNIYITNIKYINKVPQYRKIVVEKISALHRYFIIKFYELLKSTYYSFEYIDISNIKWIIEEERRNRGPADNVKVMDFNKLTALQYGYLVSDCPYLMECCKEDKILDDKFFEAAGSDCPYYESKENKFDISCTAEGVYFCRFNANYKHWNKISLDEFIYFFKVNINKSTLSRLRKGETKSECRNFFVELEDGVGLAPPFLLYNKNGNELSCANKYDGTNTLYFKIYGKLLCESGKFEGLKNKLIALRKKMGAKVFDEKIRQMETGDKAANKVVIDYRHIKKIISGKQNYCFEMTEKKMEEIIKQIEKSLEAEVSLK